MEPYYTKAEQLYEVHGNHGEDPTEGHASAQYPFPALIHEPRIQQLSDDLERAGYHPFHAPCGVRLLDGRPDRAARASGAGRATASRASSRPSPMPRCSVSARRSSTRTSRS